MKCKVCGYLNEDDALFCTNCGSALNGSEQKNTHSPEPKGDDDVSKTKSTSPVYRKWGFWVLILILIGGVVYYINRPTPATYIQASSSQKPFLRTGGTYDMDIDTDGDWEISFCSNWIKAEPIDRGLRITCSANPTGEDRKGWITLSSGKARVRIDVYQYGVASYIKTNRAQLQVGKDGGTYTVKVQTDGLDFNVRYPNYCTVDKGNASFNITIPENEGLARTDQLMVYSDQQAVNVVFSQKGVCSACSGSGQVACGRCGGSGQIITGYDLYGNAATEECPDCGGSGTMECPTCQGTGIQ